MEKFYYEYENLKYKIRKYGLLKCEEDIDNIISEFKNHRNVGLAKLKKAQVELRFKSQQVAEEILLELQNDIRDDVRLFAKRDLFRLYVDQNRSDDASIIYEQLMAIEKEKYMLQFHKVLMLRCQNNYLDSEKALSNLIRNIDRIDDLCFLENCLSEIESNHWNMFKKENYESIKKLVKKLISNNDNREKTGRRYMFLGRLEQINKNYFEALNIYRKALSSPDPKTRELAIVGICKCYFMLGDTKLQDYVEFEELKKSNSQEAISLLFEIYCQNKNLEKAEKVLENASNDAKTIYNRAKLERLKGNYIESLKLFNRCFEFSRDFSLKANSLINIVKIYVYFKEYKEAFELVNTNRNILFALGETGYYQMYAFLCKKMGVEYDMKYNSYSISQILDYDLNFACEHIKKHEHDFENIEFYENDLEKFLVDIREKLDGKEQLLSTIFDYYKVKVYTKDGKETYVKVVVTPETKDIITCYADDNLIFTEVDIDEEIESKPKEKVIKRKSQIDKFNEKYNLKRD